MKNIKSSKLVSLAMLSAFSFLVMLIKTPPIFPAPFNFLMYEAKDVVIVIGGFLYGPLSAMAVALVVALTEWFSGVSTTGIWGALMNFLSSCTFACTAALVYKNWRKLPGAAVGLIGGIAVTVPVMLLWNYLIVPIYTGAPRDFIAASLVPVFLPFNLIKYGLSAAITMLLYKPIRIALDKSKLLPVAATEGGKSSLKVNFGVIAVSLFIIITSVLLILSYQEII